MDKQFSTIVLVVVIGVLLGVGVVVKQNDNALIKQVLDKQDTILEGMEEDSGDSDSSDDEGDLERRVALLEVQLKTLVDLIKQGGVPAGNNQQVRPTPPSEDMNKVHDIEVAHSPILGNKNAPVRIVEFVDFQCPFCARFHGPIMEVLKSYPNQVSYMLKHFPLSFHPQAAPASMAAMAAGEQGKFFEMVDAILADNKDLSDEKLKGLAKQLGLNEKKFWDDYSNKKEEYGAIIKKDMELGAKVDVRGTPTIYINGKKTFARDAASYKREIDQILNQAK